MQRPMSAGRFSKPESVLELEAYNLVEPMQTSGPSLQPPHGEKLDAEFQSDPRWQLVQRILRTAPFQKSAHLHGLLTYLAEQAIRGKIENLTERQIGIAAFGKPADYSPAEDSAVRVHIRHLRLRLHEYFAIEGRNERSHVEIPKGSYMLEFVTTAEPQIERPAEALAPKPPPEIPKKHGRMRDLILWVALAAAGVCAVGWYRAAKEVRPAPHQVPWPLSEVIQPGVQTHVVVSDASLMLRFLEHKGISLGDYLQPGYQQSLIPPHLEPNVARMAGYIANSRLTSIADIGAVSTLTQLAGPEASEMVFSSARDLNQRELEQGNFVFVGSPISNPWVSLFADRLNFQVKEDGVGGKMLFINTKPLPGEQPIYTGLSHTGNSGEDYATIALLPSSSGEGNVLILQGLREVGTEALDEMLSDTADRAKLQQAVGLHDGSKGSPYFEALIRARAVAGAPVSIFIVATRRIQR